MSKPKDGPVHADGFQWQYGRTSDPRAWTLADPNGHPVAHVYRCHDGTWGAATASGICLGLAFTTSGEAMSAVDNECRPCAAVPCGNDRVTGSLYCTTCTARAVG